MARAWAEAGEMGEEAKSQHRGPERTRSEMTMTPRVRAPAWLEEADGLSPGEKWWSRCRRSRDRSYEAEREGRRRRRGTQSSSGKSRGCANGHSREPRQLRSTPRPAHRTAHGRGPARPAGARISPSRIRGRAREGGTGTGSRPGADVRQHRLAPRETAVDLFQVRDKSGPRPSSKASGVSRVRRQRDLMLLSQGGLGAFSHGATEQAPPQGGGAGRLSHLPPSGLPLSRPEAGRRPACVDAAEAEGVGKDGGHVTGARAQT